MENQSQPDIEALPKGVGPVLKESVHNNPESDTINQDPPIAKSRAKKRKKIPKDATAPKQPLSGYIRFLNERRDQFRADNPGLGFTEVTRLLAAEWTNLPVNTKQQFLDAAEHDKERYVKEWEEYKKTESYKEFRKNQLELKSQNIKKAKVVSNNVTKAAVPPEASVPESETKQQEVPIAPKPLQPVPIKQLANASQALHNVPTVQNTSQALIDWNICEQDIPIFTENFLHHNKMREAELRQLRKAHADYEQQNAILQRHAEEVSNARTRLLAEAERAEQRAEALVAHKTALVAALIKALGHVALPGGPKGAKEDNIEQYMFKLKELTCEGRSNHSAVKQAREILQTIKLPN